MKPEAEIAVLKTEVEILKLKLNEVLRRTGMEDAAIDALELEKITAACGRTLDFRPLQDYLRKRNAKRKGAAA